MTPVPPDSGSVLVDPLPVDTLPGTTVDTSYLTLTRSATLFSLRTSVDIAALFGVETDESDQGEGAGATSEDASGGAGGKPGGRVFAEVALLGWGNQPRLYEDRLSRIALTLGAHVPTRGLLDDLCMQAERHALHHKMQT